MRPTAVLLVILASVGHAALPKKGLLREALGRLEAMARPAPKDAVERWKPLIEESASRQGVDPALVEAVLRQENPWGDPARRSPRGALGLMQLMPRTARGLGVDPKEPGQNIDGGVRHLKHLLKRFKGDRVLAVAAYNAGEASVRRLGRVPECRETVRYVSKVFDRYGDLTGEMVLYSHRMTPQARGWIPRLSR